ncbi:MAG TPA: XRE family transcriptional regulator [Roseburia sp.]|nr:XRE family transcriptional regulator [Roseburia sp.]
MYSKYEELLKKSGETSYQVSKATGVGQNTLSNWKTGRSQPKIGKLQKIADHFGVPVTYFLEDTTSSVQLSGQQIRRESEK